MPRTLTPDHSIAFFILKWKFFLFWKWLDTCACFSNCKYFGIFAFVTFGQHTVKKKLSRAILSEMNLLLYMVMKIFSLKTSCLSSYSSENSPLLFIQFNTRESFNTKLSDFKYEGTEPLIFNYFSKIKLSYWTCTKE